MFAGSRCPESHYFAHKTDNLRNRSFSRMSVVSMILRGFIHVKLSFDEKFRTNVVSCYVLCDDDSNML